MYNADCVQTFCPDCQAPLLARYNLNHEQLLPQAKKAAAELGLKPNHNPYMITVAQVVETVHILEDSLNIIDRLLSEGLKEETNRVKVKAGRGIGAVEAPRGILFHDYNFDKNGILTKANCIIPTNQNHANIQKDMEKFLPMILDKGKDAIRLNLEMLVRAYDPCISCSCHFLKLKIDRQ
jgi:coenzyme F420-reducing hydrogenase alpha subunit